MKDPCPKFPDKLQFRTAGHADKVAVSKSWETGKLTHVYYCAAYSGGCAAYHLTTSIPFLAEDFQTIQGEDDE